MSISERFMSILNIFLLCSSAMNIRINLTKQQELRENTLKKFNVCYLSNFFFPLITNHTE